MKKFFLFCFTVFYFVGIANAQWITPVYDEGDELTELSNSWGYIYKDHDGFITFTDHLNNDNNKNSDFIAFETFESIFDYDNQYARCIIGFYSNNELVEKITTEVWVPRGRSDLAFLSAFKNSKNFFIVEKIIKHLTTVGDVRFIIPTYSAGNFDVTVTKNSELFKNTTK